jgi:ATP-binding cassette, subfamily B, bacterial MsbA
MFKNAVKLLPFVLPHKWNIVFILFSGLLLGVVASAPAMLIGLLANSLEQKNLLEQLHPLALSLAQNIIGVENLMYFATNYNLQLKVVAFGFPTIYLIFGSIRYLNYYRSRYLSEVIANELRYTLLDKLVALNARFFSNVKSGSGGLLSRALNDTLIIQQGLNQYMDLLREPFIALISFSSMLLLNYKLTLVCLIFAPIISMVIRVVSRKLRNLTNTSQDSLDLITKSLKEAVDGMRVIHAYNLEDYVRGRFRERIDSYNAIRKKVAKRMEVASPINEFLAAIVLGGLCLFVGEMTRRGEADLTTFLMFIAFAANLEKPIKKIQQAIVGSQQTEVCIARVFDIIENSEIVQELPESEQTPFPKNWSTIEFRDVKFNYGDASVLHGINLTVKRGESIAIVGESGSGKSTLVNLLERFIDPTSGSILIDNINIQNISLKKMRDEIAYVSQDTFLFDETIEENIRFGNAEKSHEKLIEAAQKANALKFIEKIPTAFSSRTGERGSNFSGGEKQRLSIARAIFKDAPILILDEATSALDSASEAEVQKGISSLIQNRTSFIIAHRLSTVQAASRILVMDNGQIVEQGSHDELLRLNKIYAQYYKLQEMSSQPGTKDLL